MYELAMRRVAVTVRVLSVVLAALVAKGIVDGLNLALGLSAVLITALLAAAVVLLFQGRLLRPSGESRLMQRHPRS
jgi:hypothetical protein